MRKLLFLALFIAVVAPACKKNGVGDTGNGDDTGVPPVEGTVSGEISGVWPKGSIQHVVGDVFVSEGKTLTIEEGVTVEMDTTKKPEFIVNGNLYVKGTEEKPVKFTVPESARTDENQFGKLWGGILASPTCAELLLDHAIIEYAGSVTTETSTSVKQGLYKAVAGEGLPGLWFANVNGKLVVSNCTFRNLSEDCTYIEGGKLLFLNNTFHTTGFSGGEAINIKSGCVADVAYNLIYSANTNALKLSNTGDRTPQAYIVAYNNTIVNTGWRRPDNKGGSVWLEKTVHADLYNNLFANVRYGIQRSLKEPEDRFISSNNYFYGYTQTSVDQFQPSDAIIAGTNDIRGTKAGENDPMFVNYPLSTALDNATFDTNWDFHLQAGSPALSKGKTDFTRLFADGIVIGGETFKSPAPSSFIGAFGTK